MLTRCNTGFFAAAWGRSKNETNLPTIENASQANAWLSRAHENERRPRGYQRAQSERPGPARGLAPTRVRPRTRVLRERAAFEAALKSGARLTSRNFVMRVHPNALTHARLGIIAARKAAPRAVDRNRGKRLIREAFRTAVDRLGGVDVTVQLKNDLRRDEPAAVRGELAGLFDKVARRTGSAPSNEQQWNRIV